jgi:hypothetical protein
VLGPTFDFAVDLTTDAKYYFSLGSNIWDSNGAGTWNPQSQLFSTPSDATGVALSGTSIYFGYAGGVLAAANPGGTPTMITNTGAAIA